MVHPAVVAAGIDGAGHHLPALAFGDGEKTIHLRCVAPPVQDLLAAMDDKAVQPGDIAGKGMGFVKNARNENPGHAAPSPDKFSEVSSATARTVAMQHWRESFFPPPWCGRGLIC